jgi:hypothetical protein
LPLRLADDRTLKKKVAADKEAVAKRGRRDKELCGGLA